MSSGEIQSLLRSLRVDAESQDWERQYLDGQIDRYAKVIELVAEHHNGGLVVEAGAVPCHLQIALEQLGFSTVGIDHAPERVKVDLDLRQANLSADTLPIEDDTVGMVVCSEVIEHLENPEHALREFRRITREGGSVVLTTPNKHRLEARLDMVFGRDTLDWVEERRQALEIGHPGHLQEFSTSELRKLVENAGLEVVDHWTCNFGTSRVPLLNLVYRIIPSIAPYQVLVARSSG